MKLRFVQPGPFLYKVLLSFFYLLLKLWVMSIRKVYLGETEYLSKEFHKSLIVTFWHDRLLSIGFLFPSHCREPRQ